MNSPSIITRRTEDDVVFLQVRRGSDEFTVHHHAQAGPSMPVSAKPNQVVLGSRSTRRRELLAHLIPHEQIVVLPPTSADEAGFESLEDEAAVHERLVQIARAKNDDVEAQIRVSWPRAHRVRSLVLTADTVIVGRDDAGRLAVLGQPPESDDWRSLVRHWFHTYYLGRTHSAVTAVCLTAADGRRDECTVTTNVSFAADAEDLVEWYLSSEEPRGKAGGYALQGAGSLFVSRIEGSLTNVIGLPLRELKQMLASAGFEGG